MIRSFFLFLSFDYREKIVKLMRKKMLEKYFFFNNNFNHLPYFTHTIFLPYYYIKNI